MNLKQLFADEEAVSPVIGVILMVAITVILAAVIGTFVLGLGDQVQSTAPTASLSFEQTTKTYDDGVAAGSLEYKAVTITHDGGATVAYDRVNVTVNGNPAYGITGGGDGSPADAQRLWGTGSSEVTAGSSVTVAFYDDNPSGGTDYEDGTADSLTEGSGSDVFNPPADAKELESGDVVSVVWNSEDGSKSSTLGKQTVA